MKLFCCGEQLTATQGVNGTDYFKCEKCGWGYNIGYEEPEEERHCVKCGKTSDLIENEDMCYSCAKERGRV